MTTPTVSSTPVLHATLVWGAIVGAACLLLAGGIGLAAAGIPGLFSGLLGALVGVVFPALTAISILIGNRWFGRPHYVEIFFGVVLGGWLLKFVLFVIALLVLARMEWVVPLVFYFSLVGSAVAALVVDLVVLSRMRLPAVSDLGLREGSAGVSGTGGAEAPSEDPRV